MSEAFVLARIGAVYGDGVTLIFDGQTAASTKRYKINTAIPFKAGDRVKVIKDSGTYIVEYVVGPSYTGGGSSGGGGVAGVTSWNGRTGAVFPQAGDYDIPAPAVAVPKAPEKEGSVGSSGRYAREDHVHPRQILDVSDLDTEKLYQALRELVFADVYPLDSYYYSDDPTDPRELFALCLRLAADGRHGQRPAFLRGRQGRGGDLYCGQSMDQIGGIKCLSL